MKVGENMTMMPNWLMQRAFLTPERIAVAAEEETVTFHELHIRTLRKAAAMQGEGMGKGSRCAVLMKNSLDMAVTIHALAYIGAQAILLNTRLTAAELDYQLRDSEAEYLLYHHALEHHWEKPSWISIDSRNLESLTETEMFEKTFHLDETATIMYTSGTTGKPKGVMQTFGNHYWSASGSSLNLGLHHDDRWLCAVPLFHISGLSILMRGIIYGMTVVLHETFQPEKANKAIMEEGVTIASVVQAMLTRMLEDLGDAKFPDSLRVMLLGGGPAPMPLLKECKEKSIPVYQTYGMTETSSQIVTLSPEYSFSKLGSAGKPLFPCRIKIMNSGAECPPMAEGEIYVQGPNVTKGYWKRESTFHDGFLPTGDIGYLDEDGFLFVLDRRSDLIVSGGENVYPAEIEAVLLSHPSVLEAGAAGADDPKWGQVPLAYVVLKEHVSEAELLSYCRERLAKYKLPSRIYFRDSLPRNASSKLMRRMLADGGRHD